MWKQRVKGMTAHWRVARSPHFFSSVVFCDGVRAIWLRDVLLAASALSADLSIGDQPAATPAATIPAMTVGAPSAELDLDLIDRDRLRDSGDAAPTTGAAPTDPKLSSLFGVCGACTEPVRECDGLRDRCISSRGWVMANRRLFSRPPLNRLRNVNSSRTSPKIGG